MADVSQAASCVETCTDSSQIVSSDSGLSSAHTDMLSSHDDDQQPHNSSGYAHGHVFDAPSSTIDKVLSQYEGDKSQQTSPGDGYGKLSSLKNCNPICAEGDGYGKLSSLNNCNPTCAEGEITQLEKNEECGVAMKMKQDRNAEEEVVLQKASDENNACANTQGKACEISCKEHCEADGDRVLDVHVDVDACSSQMNALSVNAGEGQTYEKGQIELCCTNEGMQSATARPLTATNAEECDSAPSLSSVRSDEPSTATSALRKPAAWHTAEPKTRVFPEPEFIMEASSWPTLAESRHTKPSEARSLTSNKEPVLVSLPAEKVPSSQEHPIEAPKHLNANPPQLGSKYKSSYKKSGISGYGKPNFPAAENVPVPPMGIHVPSANVLIPDQSMKGNGIVGMNTFFPGPYQARGHGPFYHRPEGLVPFPHNAAVMPAYGRGHPGWQPHIRGYGDAHSGFVPQYDQHIGPRHMRPPTTPTPFMNMSPVYYNYPNFQANDMSYMPAAPAPAPGYNYATPYYGPSGPPGGAMQASDSLTIQEKLQRQIEYYFSLENLCRDTFLRSRMDDEGFVPVSLIASFPRVQSLTWNSLLILEAMKTSSLVEVKNGKLRSYDWRRWKPSLSGTSNGINLSVPLKHTGPGKAKEQEYGNSEEPVERGPESGSRAEPWTEITANLGAGSMPAVTSIDSR